MKLLSMHAMEEGESWSIWTKATLQVLQKTLACIADVSLKDFQVSQKYLAKLCSPGDMPILPPVNERYTLKIVSWR